MEGVGYMKTVRQLSEQLGIAKQSVDYHVKKLNESYIKEGNVNMIDDRLEQLIIDRVNNNRQQTTQQTTDEQQQASDNAEDTSDTNKNTTNNSNDYKSIIEQYEARIKDLKESHANHVKDLNKQLDKKQETINNLTVSMTMQGLNAKPNTNEDNTRSVINSESNQSDNTNVEDADVKDVSNKATESTDTHTDIKESTDTNVEDVKENNVKSNKRTWLDKLLGLNK